MKLMTVKKYQMFLCFFLFLFLFIQLASAISWTRTIYYTVGQSNYSNYSNFSAFTDFWDNIDTPFDFSQAKFSDNISIGNASTKINGTRITTEELFADNICYSDGTNCTSGGTETNWNANYSIFLTHITWANVMNGTLLKASEWNSTNSTYNTWAYNQTIPALNVANTKALPGNCVGQIVQNTTTNGVQCIPIPSIIELDPFWSTNYTNMLVDCSDGNYNYGIYNNGSFKCRNDRTILSSNLYASTITDYTQIFVIPLTSNKINIIQVYLVQNSSAIIRGVQNKANLSNDNYPGTCKYITMSNLGEFVAPVILTTTTSDSNALSSFLEPTLNTIECSILTNASSTNLIISFQPETAGTVQTFAGSYYTMVVY